MEWIKQMGTQNFRNKHYNKKHNKLPPLISETFTDANGISTKIDNGKFKVFDEDIKLDAEFDRAHFSGFSDREILKEKEYCGVMFFTIGSYDAKKATGYNIYPGWVLVKELKEIINIKTKD